MKRPLFIFLLIAAVTGGVFWTKQHVADKPAAEAKPPEEEVTKITHDSSGNVVVHMPDEIQGEAGIAVSTPSVAQLSPEFKGYGRVVDPAPLAALVLELTSARIAYDFAHEEAKRMKVLKDQNNASERALAMATEVADHNQTVLLATLAKIAPVWGEELFQRVSQMTRPEVSASTNFPLLELLTNRKSILVRVDLPAGQTLEMSDIRGARLVPLGENPTEVPAQFFDAAPNVDPLTQGLGLFFLVPENRTRLAPGVAMTAFIQTSGPPRSGVIIPSEAVVRAGGAAWVYVMGAGSDTFTRTEIPLDHSVEKGWFVAKGITPSNYIVTTGAQLILSQETKPAGAPD